MNHLQKLLLCQTEVIAVIERSQPRIQNSKCGSKPVTVQLHYLEPIPYEQFKDMKTVELAALVKARIQQTLDQYAR